MKPGKEAGPKQLEEAVQASQRDGGGDQRAERRWRQRGARMKKAEKEENHPILK